MTDLSKIPGSRIEATGLTSEKIKNSNANETTITELKVWTGTKAEYDALETLDWYAWVVDNITYYTKSATPAVGDTIYNEAKEDTGKTISAVGDGYIEYNETVVYSIKAMNGNTYGYANGQRIYLSSTETTFTVTENPFWFYSEQSGGSLDASSNCTTGSIEYGGWTFDGNNYYIRYLVQTTNPSIGTAKLVRLLPP